VQFSVKVVVIAGGRSRGAEDLRLPQPGLGVTLPYNQGGA